MKYLSVLIASLLCTMSMYAEEPLILDNANHTFYVNSISAIEGKDSIVKSLEVIGFKMKSEEQDEAEILMHRRKITITRLEAEILTDEQVKTLTGGLFHNLPSGKTYNDSGALISIYSFPNGLIEKIYLCLWVDGDTNDHVTDNRDLKEIHKRLSAAFSHSKVGNSRTGSLTYYNDDGIQFYYPDNYSISLERK